MTSLPGGPEAHASHLGSVLTTLATARKATVAALADETQSPKGRGVLEQILIVLCKDDPDFLVGRVQSARGEDTLRALHLLARVSEDHARQALGRKLVSGDPETRTVLLQALPRIRGLVDARVLDAVTRVASSGGALRIQAVNTLKALGAREALNLLWEWARSKEFESWDHETISTVLGALAALCPDRSALDHIEEILARRSWFRRRSLEELQAAAARALGSSNSPRAYKLLGEYVQAGSDDVRKACRLAQREILSRRRRAEETRAVTAQPGQPGPGDAS